jgi:1,6-anhydro-N-acetylmuramate kinase
MTNDVQEPDKKSALVHRETTHPEPGEPAIQLQGRRVNAAFLDEQGGLHHASGIVRLDRETGELMVKGRVDGVRGQTVLPRRNVNVKVKPEWLAVELEPLPAKEEGAETTAAEQWADAVRPRTAPARITGEKGRPR